MPLEEWNNSAGFISSTSVGKSALIGDAGAIRLSTSEIWFWSKLLAGFKPWFKMLTSSQLFEILGTWRLVGTECKNEPLGDRGNALEYCEGTHDVDDGKG